MNDNDLAHDSGHDLITSARPEMIRSRMDRVIIRHKLEGSYIAAGCSNVSGMSVRHINQTRRQRLYSHLVH